MTQLRLIQVYLDGKMGYRAKFQNEKWQVFEYSIDKYYDSTHWGKIYEVEITTDPSDTQRGKIARIVL